ncbi:MAG: PKD domain-containing protein [Thermoanaerobaculia bacterium]
MSVAATLLSAAANPVAAAEKRDGAPLPARLRDLPRERAAWNALLRQDALGGLSAERRLEALRRSCELPVDAAMRRPPSPRGSLVTFPGLSWSALGPRTAQSLADYGFAFGDVAGRINCVTIHPTNHAILLVGSSSGGIWKSTDSGSSFRPVSDGAPALAISGITYVASNPSIVYAATGDVDAAFDEFTPAVSLGTYLGAGVLRSVDGGESWTRIDTNLPPSSIVSRVLVHPTNPQLVLAGLYITQDLAANGKRSGGMYRSTDGGVTFARTLAAPISDLVQDPNAASSVLAGSGLVSGCADCADPNGVYRSTDFGVSWAGVLVPATELVPGVAGRPFESPTGNIRLSISRGAQTVVYASIVDRNDSHEGGGIFRSTDAGATWSRRATNPSMCESQCFYDHWIAASPTQPDTLFFGAIDLFKSTDGAATWTQVTDVYTTGSSVHPDYHAATFVPGSSSQSVYFANDGGLYRTADGGRSFQNLNATLTLAQFNGIALHPVDPSFAIGGTQDNGNLRFKNSLSWSDRTAGDGGFNLIQRDSPSRLLAANYFAFLNTSTDGGETFRDACPALLMNCNTGAPLDPMLFYPPAAAAPTAPSTVFIGTNRVWASTTFGANTGGWAPRSATAIATGIRLSALAVSGDGNGVIWSGTQGGGVRLSTDGGRTFGSAAAGLPKQIVTRIRAISDDGRSAYVSFGGYSGLPSLHIFRTNDAGQSWVNVTGNLPDVPVLSLAVDPGDPADLFAGTDVGVFRSVDGGASWSSFNEGLPSVSVTDLTFHPVTRDLVAATYGRGAFRIGFSGLTQLLPTADFTFSPELPAPGQSIVFADRSSGAPTAYSWDFGDGSVPSTDRSPRRVFAQPLSTTVRLQVTNAVGSSAKTRTLNVFPGVGVPVVLQVPVVLDVFGVSPTHYTSDLVLVNRGTLPTRVTLFYSPSPGTPGASGPHVGVSLDAGREFRVDDVVAFLRASGYALPESGPAIVGTLRITFEDVDDARLVFAGSRTSTPNPNTSIGGSFGLFTGGLPIASAPGTTATIYGLREDSAFRSNLAIVDVAGGSGPASLSIQRVNGDTGLPAGSAIVYTLAPGEWHQFGSILAGTGASNGYARVTKSGGGSNRFLVYGVLNDGASSGGGTSDGSFLGADASAGLIPIVLRVNSGSTLFTTELLLANPTAAAATVSLTYTPSLVFGATGTPLTASLPLAAGRQLRIPDAITFLRDTLGLALAPGSVNQGGTLNVTGAIATARTSNPNPDSEVGGTFGLAYPAIPSGARARTSAWVYGLVQNASTRSNLAIADARVGSSAPVTYVIDVFDAALGEGSIPARSFTASLAGGQWIQFGKVLADAGLSTGFVRVRPQSGSSDFVVYGILNDGESSGERTSDGSYVPMSGVE